ncbi:MAG TPA: phage tail protein, partial [Rhodospirillaceae bacterium]|nr:phage tail protein [Rhodospirillaceae bacterium]
LLTKGGGTVKVDAGGRVVIERAVTSYKTTASGAADPSLRDLNTLRLMSYYRRSVVNTWQRKFPRHKLAGNDQPVNLGQAIMTPAGAKAEMIAHYEKLVSAGLFQDLAAYKDTILVEIDANQPGRLNIFDRPKPIGQLRQTAMRAAFRL